MTRKTTALVACLAGAAALAPAAGASPFEPKEARFVAYVEGKQVTKWNQPRTSGQAGCQGVRWREGGGEETIRFRTKPTRILVEKFGRGAVHVKYGTWDRFEPPKLDGLEAKGKLTRTGRLVTGIEPGWCFGGGPTVTDSGPYDCGTIPWVGQEILLDWDGNRVKVQNSSEFVPLNFGNCPIRVGPEVDDGRFTTVSQRYPVRDLFDRSQGLVEVLGRKTWTYTPRDKSVTTTTTASFRLRLRRAR
jgi:hypothetical protein